MINPDFGIAELIVSFIEVAFSLALPVAILSFYTRFMSSSKVLKSILSKIEHRSSWKNGRET